LLQFAYVFAVMEVIHFACWLVGRSRALPDRSAR
jgi:hypothetical protein